MHSLRKSNSIWRRLGHLAVVVDLRSCLIISMVLMALLWGVISVAAGGNSNYPAGI
ncbi:MAG: hypothetical protein QMC87_06750 [Methanothermobacter thermautotrophicus]|nr:hypothetical protein [Methanothermobacter thermautotrophicus]